MEYLFLFIATVGFNPYFWDYKDQVNSDWLFLMFVFLSLFLIEYDFQSKKTQKFHYINAILIGILIYLAYGTRSIGVVLIPSLFIRVLIKFNRITLSSIISFIIIFSLMLLQSNFLHNDGGYIKQINFNPLILFTNIFYYLKGTSNIFDNGFSILLKIILFASTLCFALMGYLKRIKNDITVFEIFTILYLIPILIWNSDDVRHLIPIIPLIIFYAFFGIQNLKILQYRNLKYFVITFFSFSIALSYIGRYSQINYGPINEGVGQKETIELFDFIRQNTGQQEVFIFWKPRVLSLYTGRNASIYHMPAKNDRLIEYFRDIHASYIITGPINPALLLNRPADSELLQFLPDYIKNNNSHFSLVFSNNDFNLYKILDLPND